MRPRNVIFTALLLGGLALTATAASSKDAVGSARLAAPPAPALVARVLPQVRGAARPGEVVSTTAGRWNGRALSFDYRWLRCKAGGTQCRLIGGRHSASYTLTEADVGKGIRSLVIARSTTGQRAVASVARTVQPARAIASRSSRPVASRPKLMRPIPPPRKPPGQSPTPSPPVPPSPVAPPPPPEEPPSPPPAPAPNPGASQPGPPAADRLAAIDVLRDFGTNDSAIRRAVGAAQSAGKALYFAPGTYRYQGFLLLDGVSAFGDGASSVLEAIDPTESAVILRGSGVSLRNLKITSPTASRRLGPHNAGGVYVDRARGFVVDGVTVARVASAGMIVLGASNGSITNNVVSQSLSDGIHITGGSRDIAVRGNRVRDTGDDMIAVVSYLADGTVSSDITIEDNDVRGQSWGRGISVVGGRNVAVRRNSIAETAGAGVLVNSDGSFGTYGTSDVRVTQNTIAGTDRRGIRHGGIHIEGWPGQLVQGTVVSGNTISDTGYRGIVVGAYTTDTSITDNSVARTANEGIFVWGGSNPTITGNRVESTAIYGIYVARSTTGRLSVLDNTLRDVNTSRSAAVDAVHVEAGSALQAGEIKRNSLAAPAGYPLDRLVECVNPQIAVADNRTI